MPAAVINVWWKQTNLSATTKNRRWLSLFFRPPFVEISIFLLILHFFPFRSVRLVGYIQVIMLTFAIFLQKKKRKEEKKTINNNKSNNETKLLLLLMLLLRMKIKNATLLFVIIFSYFCCLKMRIDSIRKYYVYFSTIRSPPFFLLLHQVLCFMGSV